MPKVYFITGATKGLGFALVKQLSAREDTKVLAAVINIAEAIELKKLQEEHKNIEILPLDVSKQSSFDELTKLLSAAAPEGIDVFISNAGIDNSTGAVIGAERSKWLEHYQTNTLGAIFSFQTVYPYLVMKETKKAFFITSLAGSMGQYAGFSMNAYGQSKAALNYTVKETSVELAAEGFTVCAFHPGLVSSDMGNTAIARVDVENLGIFKNLIITPDDSATMLSKIFDRLDKEQTGKFLSYDGSELLW